jgi:hypothetical protein
MRVVAEIYLQFTKEEYDRAIDYCTDKNGKFHLVIFKALFVPLLDYSSVFNELFLEAEFATNDIMIMVDGYFVALPNQKNEGE